MNRTHPNSVKPIPRRPSLPAKRAEPERQGIEQRHWVKFFSAGLFMTTYGSFEFLGRRAEVPNVFNDPVYASYWVLVGIVLLVAAMMLRTFGDR